jgi:O-antigen/teichoic acid export membrane protein
MRVEYGSARAVAVLFSGTVLAQFVSLFTSPLLARIFAPAEFGVLAGFIGIVSIASILVTGRYEWAIVPARSRATAIDVMRLALLIAFAMSALAAVVVPFLPHHASIPSAMLLLLGSSIFMVAAERVMSTSLTRDGAFSVLALNRIIQSVATVSLQAIAGLAGLGAWGLVGGQLLGQAAALSAARRGLDVKRLLRVDRRAISAYTALAAKLRSYPLMMMPGSLANEGVNQLPLFVFLGAYGAESAGLMAMVQRLITAPVSLVATAVGEVFRSEAARSFRERGDCRGVLLRYLVSTVIGAAVLSTATYLVGGRLLAALFGPQWEGVEPITQVMALLMFGQIIALPFAQTSLLAGLQGWDLLWNLVRLVVIAIVLAACVLSGMPFLHTLLVYCITSMLFHLLHLTLQFHAAGGRGIVRP